MRKEFELSDLQLKFLLKASQPTPYMVVGGSPPPSPQDNANTAWQALAEELSFAYKTVRPVDGKDKHFFTAEVL